MKYILTCFGLAISSLGQNSISNHIDKYFHFTTDKPKNQHKQSEKKTGAMIANTFSFLFFSLSAFANVKTPTLCSFNLVFSELNNECSIDSDNLLLLEAIQLYTHLFNIIEKYIIITIYLPSPPL